MKKFIIIFILFPLIGIIYILFQNQTQKQCENKSFSTLHLIQNPYSISLLNQKDKIFVQIQKDKIFPASSFIKNLYQALNPLCSELVYEYQPNYFEDSFCFLISETEKKEICRGKKLQKGYPIILKNNGQIDSKMYIIESYNWDRLEELVKNFKEENLKNFLNGLIDRRILILPEKSNFNSIEIEQDKEIYKFYKKNNEWFFNEKKINNSIIISLINKLKMMEQEIEIHKNIDHQKLKKIFSISFTLEFEQWKYSLFEEKKYQLRFYQMEEDYLVNNRENFYFTSKNNIEDIFKNIENLKQEILKENQK